MNQDVKLAAKFLKTLSHPERLLMLCQMVEGEKSVTELLKLSNLSQSAFSQHLAILRREKLVNTRKEKQTIYYSILDERAISIIEVLHKLFCKKEK